MMADVVKSLIVAVVNCPKTQLNFLKIHIIFSNVQKLTINKIMVFKVHAEFFGLAIL